MDIDVEKTKEDETRTFFEVTLGENDRVAPFAVTVGKEYASRIAPGVAPERLVEASFRFLLDREPKEAILRTFDISVIARYFPEYEEKIGEYLSGR